MTQDKCTYTVAVESVFRAGSVKEVCNEQTLNNDAFEATVIDETDDELTVEVHGDGYEIPVFEQEIESLDGATVRSAEVEPGQSKFA